MKDLQSERYPDGSREFYVWELRDLGSEWGPWSGGDENYLRAIETGVHWIGRHDGIQSTAWVL